MERTSQRLQRVQRLMISPNGKAPKKRQKRQRLSFRTCQSSKWTKPAAESSHDTSSDASNCADVSTKPSEKEKKKGRRRWQSLSVTSTKRDLLDDDELDALIEDMSGIVEEACRSETARKSVPAGQAKGSLKAKAKAKTEAKAKATPKLAAKEKAAASKAKTSNTAKVKSATAVGLAQQLSETSYMAP